MKKAHININPKSLIRYYGLYVIVIFLLFFLTATKYLYDKVYLTVINPSFDLSVEEMEYNSIDLSMKKFNTIMERIEAKNKNRYYTGKKDIFN